MTPAKTSFSRRGIFLLPNLFTTGALIAGFYSIVAAVDGNFQNAGAAIFVAFVLDGIDGRVARLTEWNVAWDRVGWLVAFLFALVAAFVWFSSELELAGLGGLALAFIITLTAGVLMVSGFRYYSFKEVNPGRRIPFTYMIGIVLIFILISLYPPSVFLVLFAVYASSGPIYWLWRKRAARPRQNHAG